MIAISSHNSNFAKWLPRGTVTVSEVSSYASRLPKYYSMQQLTELLELENVFIYKIKV